MASSREIESCSQPYPGATKGRQPNAGTALQDRLNNLIAQMNHAEKHVREAALDAWRKSATLPSYL